MHISFLRLFMISAILWNVFLIGCGYRLRANGEPIGVELESLAIPLITSTSSVEGFEADFTRIIRDEFISHSKVPIVPREEAHGVLSGRVYRISSQPVAYEIQKTNVSGSLVSYSTSSRKRLRLTLEMSLTDRRTGKIIWHEKSMEEEAVFNVGTDPLENRYNEKIALEKIAGLLAKRIYLKTMERF